MDCRAGLRTHEQADTILPPVHGLPASRLRSQWPCCAPSRLPLRGQYRHCAPGHPDARTCFPFHPLGTTFPRGHRAAETIIGRESMLADRIRKHIQNLPLFLDAAENLKDIVRAWMPTSPRSKPRLRSSSTFASACVPKTATCVSSSRRPRAMPSASTIESIRRAQSSRY